MQANKSLYGQYIEAREGFDIIENPFGFVTFKITGDECYVRDIFVEKHHRNDRVASALCDKVKVIAKERGCKFLTGSVVPSLPSSTVSLKVILSYGFLLHSSQNDFIIFKMEI